jgi:hypothetical protein
MARRKKTITASSVRAESFAIHHVQNQGIGAVKKELGNRCYERITQPQSLAVFADSLLRNFLAALQELAL